MTMTVTVIDGVFVDCATVPKLTLDPPKVDCMGLPAPGRTCTQDYDVGTTVTLTAVTTCGETCWSGDCASATGSTCTLKMDIKHSAGVRFIFGSCITSAEPPAAGFAWDIDLAVPGAIGQAVVDGNLVVAESGRRIQAITRARAGDTVVAASLVRATGSPGTWRFEAPGGESIEPSSLRVLRGEVALLTPTAVVFRLKGVAGEQVAFSYRLRR